MTITDNPQATDLSVPNVLAPAGPTSPPAVADAIPTQTSPVVDPLLYIHVTTLGDLEHQRIANQHRYGALTRNTPDGDGVLRGWGLPPTHPDVKRLADLIEALQTLEHQAELTLKRALRRCALYPWIKAQTGFGDRQVARLLGAIGDPYWNMTTDAPRTVSQLWAYCGLHVLPAGGRPQASDPGPRSCDAQDVDAGVAARRIKGKQANWSTEAKMRAHLVAAQCIRYRGGEDALGRALAHSSYRDAYDQRRTHTSVTHPDWTDGHSHNDALRIVSKAILRDLWREAKRLHEEGAHQ